MKIFLFILFTLAVFTPIKDVEWRMYPNPAKEGVLPKYVKIYDMNGKLVQKDLIQGKMMVRVELNLRPGNYIVKLEDR
jgi:hypothetical protein